MKIIITGDAGIGKSTVATWLNKKTSIEFNSSDDILYKKKFSEYREKNKQIEMVKSIVQKEEWILEGTTRHLIEPAISKADIVFYLRFKNKRTQLFELIKRGLNRKEPFKKIMDLAWHAYKKKQSDTYRTIVKKAAQKKYIEITGRKNIKPIIKNYLSNR